MQKGEQTMVEYTQEAAYRCPTDASKVKHTIVFRKDEQDPYAEEQVVSFVCSRNSACVKCAQNYRD